MQAGSGTKEAWIAQLRAQAALGRMLEVLSRAGLRALPVKGVVTGPMLYADLGERPLLDVDLRVRPADFARAKAAGERAGFRVLHRDRAYQVVVFDVDGMQVDIETQVGPRGMSRLSVEEMVAHATLVRGGQLVPEIHEHAALLVLNVWKDKLRFAAAHAFEDLRRIVRQPTFRDGRFVEVIARAGVSTVAWLVADFLAETRGDQRWTELREALDRVRPPRRAYASMFRAILRAEEAPPWLLTLIARAGSDAPSPRLRALGYMAWHAAEAWLARAHA